MKGKTAKLLGYNKPTTEERHETLLLAVKLFGKGKVIQMLNGLATMNMLGKHPENVKMYRDDIKWLNLYR